jgi:N6-L-threonylcarbamoyladenine synthase
MLILSIETSCDETAMAIILAKKNNFITLSNIVSSQVKLHAEWGGVVPNLAAREHLKNILPVLEQTLKGAKIKLSDIDLIAVTAGPGLIPALLLGVNSAKTLAYFYQKPLVGVHHVAGHILSAFSDDEFNFSVKKSDFPLLTLTVSGGHTQLIHTDQPFNYKIIGETQDDAAGEAFDKVAKILGLGYPGGPIISKLADKYIKENNIDLVELDTQPNDTSVKKFFPRPMINKPNFDFSFSGLKTAVLYYCQQNNLTSNKATQSLPEHTDLSKVQEKNEDFYKAYKSTSSKTEVSDEEIRQMSIAQVAFEFQEAVVDVLVTKTIWALKKYPSQTVSLSGGVAANTRLRSKLENAVKQQNLQFKVPPLSLTGDNATMIAVAGYYQYLYHKQNNTLNIPQNNWQTLDAQADLKLSPQKINIKNY